MKNMISDKAVLEEIGHRLSRFRIERGGHSSQAGHRVWSLKTHSRADRSWRVNAELNPDTRHESSRHS